MKSWCCSTSTGERSGGSWSSTRKDRTTSSPLTSRATARWTSSAPNHAEVHPVVVWENQLAPKAAAVAPAGSLDKWTYIEVDSRRASRKFGLAMADLNHDGLGDIASGQYVYLNPGGDLTGPWTRRELPAADPRCAARRERQRQPAGRPDRDGPSRRRVLVGSDRQRGHFVDQSEGRFDGEGRSQHQLARVRRRAASSR